MKLTLIAAIGRNREIGKGNALLWHLPADLAHFKARTIGKPIIMGRKTYESIGRPLPKRKNIVISRNLELQIEGVTIVSSFPEAIAVAKEEQIDEIFVIGGASVYSEALPYATNLALTLLDAEDSDADAFFPEWDAEKWAETSRETRKKDAENPIDMTFIELEKR